jgi:uncharacterized protein (TIGR02996 family)
MAEDEDFLRAILQAPDDDGPRLRYAEWLEGRGDPRGEFIRVECELDGADGLDEDDRRWIELKSRETQLLCRYRDTWWSRPVGERVLGVEFRRGFVWGIDVTAAGFSEHADALFRLEPIQCVRFEPMRRGLRFYGPLPSEWGSAQASSPHMKRLTTLGLNHNRIGPEGVRELIDSPHLDRLIALHLAVNAIGGGGLAALAGSRLLAQLEDLDLSANGISATGIRALLDSPLAGRLAKLDLASNDLGASGVEALSRSPHLHRLTRLGLACNLLGESGARALAQAASLPCLTELDLRGNALGDEAMQVLADCSLLQRLTSLDLSENPFGVWGVQALIASSSLTGLRRLSLARAGPGSRPNLWGEGLGDAGAEELGAWPHLGRLTRLDLSGNRISEVGIGSLLGSPDPTRLTARERLNRARAARAGAGISKDRRFCWAVLNLSGNPIGDAGARALAETPLLAGLATLSLDCTRIGHRGVEALAASPHLAGLTTLHLASNWIRDPGLIALAGSPHLRRLTTLTIGDHISDKGLRALAASPFLDRLCELQIRGPQASEGTIGALRERFGDGVTFTRVGRQ